MNRRKVFKSLLSSLAALPLLGKEAPAKSIPEPGLPGGKILVPQNLGFFYKGWVVRWTGWKGDQGTDVIAAQWYAYRNNLHGKRLYVSNPGTWGIYYPFQIFDLSSKVGQILTTDNTPRETLESIQAEMRSAMVRLIDHMSDYDLKEGSSPPPLPITNPEFGDEYRDCWHRFSPTMIRTLQEEEEHRLIITSKYKFGFTDYKQSALKAFYDPSFSGFDGGREIASPIIFKKL